MRSLNKILLIGNLGDDPEIRYSNAGKKLANISLATTDKWKDKETGEMKEDTQWHRITLWGFDADLADEYFKKGMRLYVEGSLKYSKSTDGDGETKYFTNITGRQVMMLDRKEGGGAREGGGPSPAERRSQQEAPATSKSQEKRLAATKGKASNVTVKEAPAEPEFDDDIPF